MNGKENKAIPVQSSAQETHCLTQLHMQHVIHVHHETWLEQMIKDVYTNVGSSFSREPIILVLTLYRMIHRGTTILLMRI